MSPQQDRVNGACRLAEKTWSSGADRKEVYSTVVRQYPEFRSDGNPLYTIVEDSRPCNQTTKKGS
jgi:hypothetical protein